MRCEVMPGEKRLVKTLELVQTFRAPRRGAMADGPVMLVTGANQGLGLALVEALCSSAEPSAAVYLGARSQERGEAALEKLKAKGLRPELALVDVASPESVQKCAEMIQERHGGADLVIHNAAARMTPEKTPPEYVREFVTTNNLGTTAMLRSFLPVMRPGGRLLVVASGFGTLTKLPEPRGLKFLLEPPREVRCPKLDSGGPGQGDAGIFSAQNLNLKTKAFMHGLERSSCVEGYVAAVEDGKAAEEGWPDWVNIPSKVGQVAAVKVAAAAFSQLFVGACCPGLVDTAASRPWFKDMSHAQSPAEAATDVVWLAKEGVGHGRPAGGVGPEAKDHRMDVGLQIAVS
eukprot:s1849_g2.t3